MIPNNHDWIMALLTGIFVMIVLLSCISQAEAKSIEQTVCVKEEKV